MLASFFASSACRSSPPAPASPPAANLPAPAVAAARAATVPEWADRWWKVVDATVERSIIGGFVRPMAHELTFYEPKRDRFYRKQGRIEDGDARRCVWRLDGEQMVVIGTLERTSTGARLTFESPGRPHPFDLTLERDDDGHGGELTALAAKRSPPADACTRAKACCEAAMPFVGATCKADDELGVPPDPENCVRFSKNIREIFADKRMALPRACD